jgi:hypothetical protein
MIPGRLIDAAYHLTRAAVLAAGVPFVFVNAALHADILQAFRQHTAAHPPGN